MEIISLILEVLFVFTWVMLPFAGAAIVENYQSFLQAKHHETLQTLAAQEHKAYVDDLFRQIG